MYLHTQGLNLLTCRPPFDRVKGAYGLIREAIEKGNAIITAKMYDIGVEPKQWQLEIAERIEWPELIEVVKSVLGTLKKRRKMSIHFTEQTTLDATQDDWDYVTAGTPDLLSQSMREDIGV
jgi:hypothetical protein